MEVFTARMPSQTILSNLFFSFFCGRDGCLFFDFPNPEIGSNQRKKNGDTSNTIQNQGKEMLGHQ
jgi:hypothetical protein